jgi:hypothetical protein
MKRARWLGLVLLCGVASAQSYTRFPSKGGVTIATGIGASPTAAGMSLVSGALTLQPADATHPGAVTTGAQTIAGTKTLTGDVVMSASKIKGTFTAPQFIDMNFGSNGIRLATGSVAGGDIGLTDQGGNYFLHINTQGIFVNNVENPVPSVHHAQTGSAQAIEFGAKALTAGAASVTFATAFGAAPTCVCQDTTATAAAQCSTSATTLTLAGTSTDSLAWFCIGTK